MSYPLLMLLPLLLSQMPHYHHSEYHSLSRQYHHAEDSKHIEYVMMRVVVVVEEDGVPMV